MSPDDHDRSLAKLHLNYMTTVFPVFLWPYPNVKTPALNLHRYWLDEYNKRSRERDGHVEEGEYDDDALQLLQRLDLEELRSIVILPYEEPSDDKVFRVVLIIAASLVSPSLG